MGFDSSHRRYYYLDTTGGPHKTTAQVWDDYSSPLRSTKRMREEEEISSTDLLYDSSSYWRRRTREEEEEISRPYSSLRSVKTTREIDSSRSSNRRREEVINSNHRSSSTRRIRRDDNNSTRSSSKRRSREERNSRGEVISYSPSSNRKRARDNFHSSLVSSDRKRRIREDTSSKSNKVRDVSPNSSSDQSVITDEDVVTPVSRRRISTKCDDVSCKFCKECDDETNTPAGSFRGFVDDAVVIQILSRLPVESLLRCKSVCKQWLSLITKDKHFIHLQSTRLESPRLLCIAPQKVEDGKTQLILSANLSFKTTGSGEGIAQQVVIHKAKKAINDNWFDYHIVLEPVNGLVCFIDGIKAAVRICNVSTRQVTPWIRSTLLAEENDKLESKDDQIKIESNLHPIYQIGFDPEKKEHKVFCFWRLSANAEPFIGLYGEAAGYASWEALTVGRDTKWRRISVVPDENNSIKINEVLPLFSPRRSSVYANGTIYWRNKSMSMSGEYDVHNTATACTDYAPTDPDVIIAFDVGSEKFRVIPIPSFILDEPRGKMNRPIAMLVLGGRITLLYQMSKKIVKLWMLDDGVDKKLVNCQGKGSSNWSAESITLPFEMDTRFFGFHGVPTREDIILISGCRELGGKVAYLYSYFRQTKSFKKHDMDMTLSVPLHGNMSLFTTFTETLTPVLPSSTRQLELDF